MATVKNKQMAKVGELIPYANNARTHSPEQIEQICASIQEFGFINPILCDPEMNVLAGHGRLMAAKQLGMDKVPVLIIDGLTEEQKRAYVLADNKLTEMGGWDAEKLFDELKELENFDFSLDIFDMDKWDLDISFESDHDSNDSEPAEPKEHGYSIAYELVFNDEDEQDRWYDFLVKVKSAMPELETISERVLAVVDEWVENHG